MSYQTKVVSQYFYKKLSEWYYDDIFEGELSFDQYFEHNFDWEAWLPTEETSVKELLSYACERLEDSKINY